MLSQGARALCHAASAQWPVSLHTVVRMFQAAPLHVFFGEVSQSSDHFLMALFVFLRLSYMSCLLLFCF